MGKNKTSSTSGYTSYSKCVHDGQPIFSLKGGKIQLSGASNGGSDVTYDIDLLIRLNHNKFDYTPGRPSHIFPKEVGWLQSYVPNIIPMIDLPWFDGQKPPVPFKFFQDLYGRFEGNLCFACVGGHGRTGTAMAAMIIVDTAMSARDAIDNIKDQYCDSAIESQSQYDWLCAAANKGENLTCPPRFATHTPSGPYPPMTKYGGASASSSALINRMNKDHPKTNYHQKNESGKYCTLCTADKGDWCRNSDTDCVSAGSQK